MAQVLIVANGEWPKAFNLEEKLNDFSVIIALDGASNRLVDGGFLPHIVIGDLDSISSSVLEHCKINGVRIVHDSNQEKSDISKGLCWTHQNYPDSQVYVIGVEIGRYDHHLAAYSALFECNSSAILILNNWKAQRVDSTSKQIQIEPGTLVSLIPFGTVTGVSLKGCQYPLNDESLKTGTRGVSNKAVEPSITVSAETGNLLLLIQG